MQKTIVFTLAMLCMFTSIVQAQPTPAQPTPEERTAAALEAMTRLMERMDQRQTDLEQRLAELERRVGQQPPASNGGVPQANANNQAAGGPRMPMAQQAINSEREFWDAYNAVQAQFYNRNFGEWLREQMALQGEGASVGDILEPVIYRVVDLRQLVQLQERAQAGADVFAAWKQAHEAQQADAANTAKVREAAQKLEQLLAVLDVLAESPDFNRDPFNVQMYRKVRTGLERIRSAYEAGRAVGREDQVRDTDAAAAQQQQDERNRLIDSLLAKYRQDEDAARLRALIDLLAQVEREQQLGRRSTIDRLVEDYFRQYGDNLSEADRAALRRELGQAGQRAQETERELGQRLSVRFGLGGQQYAIVPGGYMVDTQASEKGFAVLPASQGAGVTLVNNGNSFYFDFHVREVNGNGNPVSAAALAISIEVQLIIDGQGSSATFSLQPTTVMMNGAQRPVYCLTWNEVYRALVRNRPGQERATWRASR